MNEQRGKSIEESKPAVPSPGHEKRKRAQRRTAVLTQGDRQWADEKISKNYSAVRRELAAKLNTGGH